MKKVWLVVLSIFFASLATGQTFIPGIPLCDRSFSAEAGSDVSRPSPMFIRNVFPEEIQGMRPVIVSVDMGKAHKNRWTIALAPANKDLHVGMKVMVVRLRVYVSRTEGKDRKEVKVIYIVQE